jgi:RNA-directed DNA polymerase
VLRLVRKWLTVGVVEDGKRTVSTRGTPQGAVISPLLANIFLHYVLDLWVHRWRRREATGEVIVTRYADDVIVGFQYQADAQRFRQAVQARLVAFGLELHPSKTRLIEFGRYAAERRARRGEGKPATFDFLGFTHCCSSTRQGAFTVRRLTVKKRMRAGLTLLRAELKRRRHEPVGVIGPWLRQKLQGYFNYFAVLGNLERLRAYRHDVIRAWYHALRRRSHKGRMPWVRFVRLINLFVPRVRQLHPHPLQRFGVST